MVVYLFSLRLQDGRDSVSSYSPIKAPVNKCSVSEWTLVFLPILLDHSNLYVILNYSLNSNSNVLSSIVNILVQLIYFSGHFLTVALILLSSLRSPYYAEENSVHHLFCLEEVLVAGCFCFVYFTCVCWHLSKVDSILCAIHSSYKYRLSLKRT